MSELLQGIASLTKTVQQTLNSYEVRKLGDKVQGYVMNFTETEQKVREATNEDPWGPTGPQMQEIASFTFQYDLFSEVMGILWKRLFQENKLAWRRVYKSLILLNYLLKNGSERVITTAKDHMFELRALESYKCVDERGKDEGLNVRHRVKLILELLNDEDLLRAERRKAKTDGREKYQGFSKEDMLSGRSASKFDSFERWNSKKADAKSVDFIGDNNNGDRSFSGKREVTAFDFDSSENRSHANGSPELGIRERTPEPAEENDDDFGDFTSARAGAASQKAVAVAPYIQTAVKPLPSPPLVLKQSTVSPPRAQSSASGEPDLLGLGTDFNSAPTLFAAAHSSPCIATARVPSSQPVKSQSNDLFDEIFSAQTQPSISHNNGIDNQKQGGLLDLLSQHKPNDPIASNDLLEIEPTPNYGVFEQKNRNNQTCKQQSQPQKSEPNLSKPTLGSTWEDLRGKVNIDFENLSLKPSPSKPVPSLNELKMQSTKGNVTPSSSTGDFLF